MLLPRTRAASTSEVTSFIAASALQALDVNLGAIDLLGENGIVALGAAEQRANAEDDGDAYAGSGAITDEGAIAIDNEPATDFSNASIDLSSLLGEVAPTVTWSASSTSRSAPRGDGRTGERCDADERLPDRRSRLLARSSAGRGTLRCPHRCDQRARDDHPSRTPSVVRR